VHESDNRLGPRRTGEGKAPVGIHGSRWSSIRGGTAAATVGIVLLATSPVAHGKPSEPAFPSQQEVESARQRVAETARSVQEIQADYAAAGRHLERLGIAAAQAAEAYNGALWRLEQARSEVADARRKADRAHARTARQRRHIGALVAETYQGGSDLGQVSAYLASDDPDALLDRFAAFKGASSTMQARLDRFRAAYSLQQVFEREAERAVAAADRAEQQAQVARENARQAVAAQQAAVEDITARKDALTRELARAQSISVELAAQRQQALERRAELRRQRAAQRAAERAAAEAAAAERARQARERARDAAAAQQAADARQARLEARVAGALRAREARREARQARAEAREAREARAEAREARIQARQAREERREARQARLQQLREARRQRQARAAAYSGGGASQAVAFAMAQVGEPYVWGGDGPDQWDCSGLTAGAWGSSGEYLSHYSVAQYYETTRIGYGDLRPGDLIFWSSDGSPDGIFHVAMYIGDGQMVHAANPSDPVKVDSVWYWQAPDFYGRV
jgi:cell wall-associated NlpC family hydrolase